MSDALQSLSNKRKRESENDSPRKDFKRGGAGLKASSRDVKNRWKNIKGENLVCDIMLLYDKTEADKLLNECEKTLSYNEGNLSKIRIFGKWHPIPRKQVAFGDPGLSYTFSGTTVPAVPWIPLLTDIRNEITNVTGYDFNFVLVNRYRDGNDYIGEHKDDEVDLVEGHPIASLSLGEARDFVFRHQDSRGKKASRSLDPVTVKLEHGSLLLMRYPTNKYWYHSLPKRKKIKGVRINMTFRKMDRSKCKKVTEEKTVV